MKLLAYKVGHKNLTNSEFGEFISIEKYTKLLLIECIWQSKKFDQSLIRPFRTYFFENIPQGPVL